MRRLQRSLPLGRRVGSRPARDDDRRSLVLEFLESRNLLAGDLVGHWLADGLTDLTAGAEVELWNDEITEIPANRMDGAPRWSADRLGGRAMVRFDAVDGGDNLVVPAAVNPMAGAADFSVVIAFQTSATDLTGGQSDWFKNTGLVDGSQIGFTQDWGISLNEAGQVATGLGRGLFQPTTNLYSSASGLNDGQLHVVTLTRQQGTISLYVDGGPADQRTDADIQPRANLGMSIGSLLSRSGFFNGEIGQVRIYDGQLSDAEVDQITSEIFVYYSNRPPVSISDSYQLNEDQTLAISAEEGVLANDLDDDGDLLSAVLETPPVHGELTLQPDGSFVYVPQADYHGADLFTYRTHDFRASNEFAIVALQVRPVHDLVQTVPEQYKGLPTQVLQVSVANGVLMNDINVDGSPMTAVLAEDVDQGRLTLREDGSFNYDPQGFAGTATFRYRVNDGTALSSPAEVTLVINTPPQAVADQYAIAEDSLLTRSAALGLLANDLDAEGNPRTAILESLPSHGTLTLEADGAFQYQPVGDFNGQDVFRYRISDGIDTSEGTSVTIEVTPVNDPPLAQPDAYFGLPDQSLQISAGTGVLANDTDIDTVQLEATITSAPTHGRIVLERDGAFTYTPNAGFTGIDQFRYRATDQTSQSQDTLVTVRITAQPLVISEFMTSNSQTVQTYIRATAEDKFEGELFSPDWIELHNLLSQPLDLGQTYLTDNDRMPQKWQFPAGTVIEPNGKLVVFASGLDVRDPQLDQHGWLHTNFQLSTSSGYLAIMGLGGQVIHAFGPQYPPQRTDISFGLQQLDPSQPAYFLQPTPGDPNGAGRAALVADTQFSVDRGFFTEPFQVQITSTTPTATIRYTTDGSVPSETYGRVYTAPLTIDRTTTLRAIAVADGMVSTNVDTHTYLFVRDVLQQTAQSTLAAGFPSNWRGTAPDYGLDDPGEFPRIAGDRNMPLEQAEQAIADSLLAVPTLSIVMNTDDMFGTQGIYSNPEGTGELWERATSAELIHPDGSEGFQIDAGIRIQGGAFRSFGLTKKNSLRLVFKTKYGPATLNYPLFGPDAVDEFDTLTLRMESNDGWQWGDAGGQPQYARDEFLRRTQLAMGQPASHGTSVHVYINGFYWGLYNLVERPDQSFGAAYFDSDPYDWDGINSGSPINTDGDRFRSTRTLRAWSSMQNLARDVQRAATQQEKTALLMQLQGLNPDGTDNPDYADQLDLENMIDYLIVNYYADNRDWPFKNYYVGRENSPDSTGFKFFTWDAEWSLFLRSSVTGNNITDNRGVAIPFQSLRSSDEFRVLFGDRVQKHFSPGGALYVDPQNSTWDSAHPERNVPAARYVEWTDNVFDALLAESARWGDQHRSTPYTRDVDWQREFDRIMSDWFPRRSQFLVEQFQRLNLYPDVDAAQFNQRGGPIEQGFPISLTAPRGAVYYTVDGSDPRQLGGEMNPQAIRYTQPFSLDQNATVRVRVLDGGSWSAIDEATFLVDVVPADATNVRISEVHYHPAAPSDAELAAGFDDADEFEFLELVNLSQQTVDLSQVSLVTVMVNGQEQGVDFDFIGGDLNQLGPGERLVVVENVDAFRQRYGEALPLAGAWTGRLGNGGEQITLRAGDQLVQQFTYDDGWYPETDGAGSSLEIVDITADPATWNLASAWRASLIRGGSPGSAGLADRIPGDANGDGRFDSADLTAVFIVGEYEDQIPGNSTFEEGDWNGDGDFDVHDLVYAFQAGTYVAAARPQPLDWQARDELFAEDLWKPIHETTEEMDQAGALGRTVGEADFPWGP